MIKRKLWGLLYVLIVLGTLAAARRFTPEFCRRAAELVLETDYKIKTSYDDPERLLELLLLQLAQEGRNG